MRRKLFLPALALCLSAALISPASALEYTIATDKAPAYGIPTSEEKSNCNPAQRLQFEKEEQGSEWSFRRQAEAELSGLCDDASKAAALIPPGFGSPTSYLPGSGEYLTPDLVPGQAAQGAVSGGSGTVVTPPSFDGVTPSSQENQSPVQGGVTQPTTSFTDVTSGLYYSGGYLGTLKIPSQGVNVKVYQGTDTAALAKGAGHFSETSIWAGNVCVAGHNRGAHGIFGEVHNLKKGDKIILTTKLGTRTYSVTSVAKIMEMDRSGLLPTGENCLTLYTCVRDDKPHRWCVRAVEVV